MNLATRWNPLYWACACLCVNSGNSATNFDDADEEETVVETEDEDSSDDKKEKASAPNYIKIGKALADAQQQGVNIDLPDINRAESDFVPDVANNAITYSLKAVTNVNNDLYERIVANRPYYKISEFIEKVEPTQVQMVSLIKAGAFDKLFQKPRSIILQAYFKYLAQQAIQKKDKMTATQLKQALELDMELPGFADNVRVYKFKKYISEHQHDKVNKRYILSEEDCIKFFKKYAEPKMSAQDYNVMPGGSIAVGSTKLNKVLDSYITPMIEYLSSEEGTQRFYEAQLKAHMQKNMDKYGVGNPSGWEFATLSFYHGNHELLNAKLSQGELKSFFSLPEINSPCCYVAGTVIGTENAKHLVYLNTPTGVISVKFYSSNYVMFNQKISVVNPETKKKTVIEDSWFKRGTKIVVYGQRKENIFASKTDRSTGFNRTVGVVHGLDAKGDMVIQWTRKKEK